MTRLEIETRINALTCRYDRLTIEERNLLSCLTILLQSL